MHEHSRTEALRWIRRAICLSLIGATAIFRFFDQDGKFIAEWKKFGRPSGFYISRKYTLYSVDSQSDEKTTPGVKRGIRIGSAKDGTVKVFIPDHRLTRQSRWPKA